MRVRFTETALAEIEEIQAYIAADNPTAAVIVRTQIEQTIALIATLPKIGRIKYRGVVRMLSVRRYPQYLIFYAVEANEVVILNVRHGARLKPWEA